MCESSSLWGEDLENEITPVNVSMEPEVLLIGDKIFSSNMRYNF